MKRENILFREVFIMFDVGDKVVYPMHGAGIIENIEEKEILGEKRKYFIMKMPIGEMKVMVPVDNVEEVGIREVIEADKVEEVMEELKVGMSKMPQNWNRRYRLNNDRIKTGDILEITAVVRNLMLLDIEKGLSTGEKKMLGSATQMLYSEMVLATDKEVDVIEREVVAAVKSGMEPEEEE